MGLDDSVLKFQGEIVHVHPFYGWGWSSDGTDTIPEPNSFGMRVSTFWAWRGERRGGIGRVEEPAHLLNGLWVVFSTRHAGNYDFDEHVDPVGGFNVEIYEREPTERVKEWPSSPDSQRRMHGWADIVSKSRKCELCGRATIGSHATEE